MQQSELLTQFYRAYTAWIDDGAPDRIIFSRSNGLCTNLKNWLRAVDGVVTPQTWYELDKELRLQFRQASLDEVFPFNTCGAMEYQAEQCSRALGAQCHTNAKRIAWVREHAA